MIEDTETDKWLNKLRGVVFELYLQIYVCIYVVWFWECSGTGKWFRIERKQVLLCWMQDSNLGSLRHKIANRLPFHKPTELSRIKLKSWTQWPIPMMSEHTAHTTAGIDSPMGRAIYIFVVRLWECPGTGMWFRIDRRQVGECRIWILKVWDTASPADWMSTCKPTEDQAKNSFMLSKGNLSYQLFVSKTLVTEFIISHQLTKHLEHQLCRFWWRTWQIQNTNLLKNTSCQVSFADNASCTRMRSTRNWKYCLTL